MILMAKKIKAIVVTDSCPHCEELEKRLKKRGFLKKVKIINASTKKGAEFADKYDIMAVPECVVITEADGKKVRVCSDKEFERLLKEGK